MASAGRKSEVMTRPYRVVKRHSSVIAQAGTMQKPDAFDCQTARCGDGGACDAKHDERAAHMALLASRGPA
jgi:hypothetical protein